MRATLIGASTLLVAGVVWAQGYTGGSTPVPASAGGTMPAGQCLTLVNSNGSVSSKICPNGVNAMKITNASGSTLATVDSAGRVFGSGGLETLLNTPVNLNAARTSHIQNVSDTSLRYTTAAGTHAFYTGANVEHTLGAGTHAMRQNPAVTFPYSISYQGIDGTNGTDFNVFNNAGLGGANFRMWGLASSTNSHMMQISAGSTTNGFNVSKNGSGTVRDMTFSHDSTPHLSITASGAKINTATPASTTSFAADTLSPVSFAKSWGLLTSTVGNPTISAGLNITSATCASNVITVNLGTDMSSAAYSVVCNVMNSGGIGHICFAHTRAAGSFVIQARDDAGGTLNLCGGAGHIVDFLVHGDQ